MSRDPDAFSRMETLLLSSLARTPMHGYELKLELRYKHVRWWAKCEHGHIYATLTRLERRGYIRKLPKADSRRRIYTLTPAGRSRVKRALRAQGQADDETYFDIDLFLAGAFLLEQPEVLQILEARRARLQQRLEEARALRKQMRPHVPTVGQLIMDHRVAHLGQELRFLEQARRAVAEEPRWSPFLGDRPIGEFVEQTGVQLERAADVSRRPSRSRSA